MVARVECYLCNKKVDTTKGNYQFINGFHQHKKCNKTTFLEDSEKEVYKSLTLAIKWVTDRQKKPLSPAQWRKVTSQIKNLKDEGYSYEDQLTAFKWYFDKGSEYMGYGIMEWVIQQCLEEVNTDKSAVNDEELMKERMEKLRRERLGTR